MRPIQIKDETAKELTFPCLDFRNYLETEIPLEKRLELLQHRPLFLSLFPFLCHVHGKERLLDSNPEVETL